MDHSRRLESPFVINRRVIETLVVRDMKTRFGGSYLGFLMAMTIPFFNLLVLFAVYLLTGRNAPLGTDTWAFLGIAVLPFILFIYPSRMIMLSITANKPLLYFPRVKVIDLVGARVITELLAMTLVTFSYIGLLIVIGVDMAPYDYTIFLASIGQTLFLGVAVGVFNAVFATLVPFWIFIFNVSAPLIFLLSAILILPDAVPDKYRIIFNYNPLAQCVELMRSGFYETYQSSILDPYYPMMFSIVTLAAGLLLARVMRSRMLAL